MDTAFFGPFCFGLVIGWITYRTLRRRSGEAAIGDIASVLGAVGGGAVVALFKNAAFDAYCIGLAVGFFVYLVVGLVMDKGQSQSGGARGSSWMGE
jgi:hypothetical protein